jgi:hypothetical protein
VIKAELTSQNKDDQFLFSVVLVVILFSGPIMVVISQARHNHRFILRVLRRSCGFITCRRQTSKIKQDPGPPDPQRQEGDVFETKQDDEEGEGGKGQVAAIAAGDDWFAKSQLSSNHASGPRATGPELSVVEIDM